MAYGWREYSGRQASGGLVELCDECGFDARRLVDDAEELLAAFEELEELLDDRHADRRPAVDVWSAQEYGQHVVEVTEALLGYVHDATDGRSSRSGRRAVVTDLDSAAHEVLEMDAAIDKAMSQIVIDGVYRRPVTVRWIVRHLLHDVQHHVLDVRRGYARIGLDILRGDWDAGRDPRADPDPTEPDDPDPAAQPE